MKRRYGNRPDWKRVTERRFVQMRRQEPGFSGHVTLLELTKVREPLITLRGKTPVRVADNRYLWMQHFPTGGHHSLTTMRNEKQEVVQYYFDIVKTINVTRQGMPYCDDLYLDVVLLPDGQLFLLDEDELAEALERKLIGQSDVDLAYREAKAVMSSSQEGRNELILKGEAHFRELWSRLNRQTFR